MELEVIHALTDDQMQQVRELSEDACRLYRTLGFRDIEPFYDVQHGLKGITIFMERSLVS